MSVRRLAPKELQPESFAFTAENLAWAQKEITKYPPGRQFSAVIAIMWRAQEQCGGWLPEAAIRAVADMLQMPHIRALEVATFYTMFQLNPVGKKAHVQVCGTTPCRLRGAGELIEVCKNRIHHDPFHLSADGDFSWEEVECAGACVNAPMVQIFKDVYEDLTPETLNKVLDGFASGHPPQPGPQNGRQHAAPITGPTTLKTGGINVAPIDANGPALTDDEAKRPGAAANVQERPAPKPPAADATEKNPP
ncbi:MULTISPECIES: NADH-quinone oxidoreductase subunit NuoE [Rhodopseudomonas]|uniref:NADH-quinone oxidoreductase, E subunit n=1 Tax=Rhodopseudomonas palustris (strain DX-1) TaxID=652103 RepID=E6VGK5_RHOPX|nr:MULTISPECIES: NADH-quinone oxidoreductase subunit NuoE [Rhodopseudomonas]NEW87159.1 NADH-quinone oxidoreductase subunit NuoE [Rhodopseudomonas sp. WA056]QDL97636.1 NADH-quinone oxidoreductase subunit NuoE [Rhodopseudomonas palustris]